MDTTPALQGYLKKQSKDGSFQTRFFQQESSKILYFEKDVVEGLIDMNRIVNTTRKNDLTFIINAADQQFILSPVNDNSSTVEYWLDGISSWQRKNARQARGISIGVRNRDARSQSVGGVMVQPQIRDLKSRPPPPSSSRSSGGSSGTQDSPTMLKEHRKSPNRRTGGSLMRLTAKLRDSRNDSSSSLSSTPPEGRAGSAPAPGSLSARMLSDANKPNLEVRHASRAKSMEDMSGSFHGIVARLPVAQRDNVIQLQKAFLDYRRLVLKAQIVDVHMETHTAGSQMLPEIETLDAEKRKLQEELIRVENDMRECELEYFEEGKALVESFGQMLLMVKRLHLPLNSIMHRLQTVYKAHTDLDNPVNASDISEASVLVAKFRALLPLLEDSLVLDKPLTGRQNAILEKRLELQKQNQSMKEQIRELSDSVVMTRVDCETIREFTERADAIQSIVNDMNQREKHILPWLSAPSSQMHQSLSRAFRNLEEETGPLKVFRDPNYLEVLESMARQEGVGKQADFELADDGSLAYASAEKMVDLIVTGKGTAYALDFPKIFVHSFRMFMQPMELLEKLVLIYCTVPADGAGRDLVADERKLAPCRLRILNLLKKWISNHKYDFEDRAISQLVHDFLDNTLKLTGYERVADNLSLLLSAAAWPQPMPCPTPIYPPEKTTLDLLDIDPVELARQMTLDDLVLYSSLEVRDFMDCAWSDRQNPGKALTIRAVTEDFNATAEWVTGLILNPLIDDQTRAKCLRHLIQTAQELLRINNFSSCIKIIGALSGQSVFRLHTWDRVPKEDMKTYEEMRSLIANQWAGLRELMSTCSPPSIPLISPFLGDLTYVNEMKTKSGKKSNLLNFRKLTLTSQAIGKALRHHDFRYWFTDVPTIRRWFKHCEKTLRLGPTEAHQRSLNLQPRESK